MDHYYEEVRSFKTSLLFLFLSAVFSTFFIKRVLTLGYRENIAFSTVLLFFSIFFGLYVLNYWTLKIIITDKKIQLNFGLIRWRSDLSNVKAVEMDDSPPVIKYGGAGVHFAYVRGMYRAFFNFLEFPRILITYQEKQGLVQGLVFTTRNPEKVIKIIKGRMENNEN